MKKLIAIIALAALLAGVFCSCDGVRLKSTLPSMTQNARETAQNNLISSFGVTLKDDKIVAFNSSENKFLEYIYVDYTNGAKVLEKTYYFYSTEEYYEDAKKNYTDAKSVEFNDDACCVIVRTNKASGATYNENFEIIKADYEIKGYIQ